MSTSDDELARRLREAAIAIEQHEGPKSGPEFEAKVAAWKRAYRDLVGATPEPSEDA